ncbi:MAG: glycosyltransferase family A protein [Candidatus Berkelbacteria bacterium]|nr:glycosyltransferase family A protein [Candidatus Berkelbacteria bacterium]
MVRGGSGSPRRTDEKDFEVIVVDSGSADRTLQIAESFQSKINLKIYKIKPNEFTYPYACNFAAQKASGDFLVYLSGHSVPINSEWLGNGLDNFKEERIAGIYGNIQPLPDASIWEKIYYGFGFFKSKKIISKARIGVLGNTNSIIRKNLWQQHLFDEGLIKGGEDTAWARYFLNKGYLIVRDPKFSVYHSHGLGLFKFLKQVRHWHKISKVA